MDTRSFRTGRIVATPTLFLLLAASCNQLLGIEQADVDPRLSQAGTQGAGASGGTDSGSGGSSGSSSSGTGGDLTTAGTGGTAGVISEVGGAGAGGEAGAGNAGSGGKAGSGGSSTNQGGEDGMGEAGQSGAGGEGGAPGPADLCPEYCDEMIGQCDGTTTQYLDRQQCERICSLLPQGVIGAPDSNTVACRLKYAQKTHYGSEAEAANYCRKAGPGGDGACGGNCESVCTLMMSVCTEQSAGVYRFDTVPQCQDACNALPPSSIPYSTSNPLVADGNHAQCRLFHVTSAAMADPDEHCGHAMGLTLCEDTTQAQ